MNVANEVRRYAQAHPTAPARVIARAVWTQTGCDWLDTEEVRRILARKPKGACPVTPAQIERGRRMRADGATWDEVGRALRVNRHTAAKWVRGTKGEVTP